jgi:hypothetical protein
VDDNFVLQVQRLVVVAMADPNVEKFELRMDKEGIDSVLIQRFKRYSCPDPMPLGEPVGEDSLPSAPIEAKYPRTM